MPITDNVSYLKEGTQSIINRLRDEKEKFLAKVKSQSFLEKARLDISKREQRISAQKNSYLTASRMHKLKIHQQRKQTVSTKNLSQRYQRLSRKSVGKSALEKNISVSKISNKSISLFKGKSAGETLHKLASNKWARRTAIGLASAFAISKISNVINSLNPDRRAIPEHYERTYDAINEISTDFGSPVKLWKTAAKTISPYKSSVRKGLRTSVRQQIDGNVALDLAANAINHMKY